jgi:hypothetical protein
MTRPVASHSCDVTVFQFRSSTCDCLMRVVGSRASGTPRPWLERLGMDDGRAWLTVHLPTFRQGLARRWKPVAGIRGAPAIHPVVSVSQNKRFSPKCTPTLTSMFCALHWTTNRHRPSSISAMAVSSVMRQRRPRAWVPPRCVIGLCTSTKSPRKTHPASRGGAAEQESDHCADCSPNDLVSHRMRQP